ncbi:hypothetical protein HPB47_014716, partial [Ixodes persulcatus]
MTTYSKVAQSGEALFGVQKGLFQEERPIHLSDRTRCTPVPGKFYLVYRNFEEDPIFGGTAKCVVVTEANKTATGSLLTATYDGGSSTYTASLTSSPGYDVKNVLQIHAEATYTNGVTHDSQPNGTKDLVIAYLECAKCKLLRNKYISS